MEKSQKLLLQHEAFHLLEALRRKAARDAQTLSLSLCILLCTEESHVT